MLTQSMKKNIDKGLSDCLPNSKIDYYGSYHLRLVCNQKIIGVISLDKTSLSEVQDYLVSQGFQLGKEIDPAEVKSVPNSKFNWK